MKNQEDHLLDDLAPRPKREKRKHKYQSTKGLPVDVAIRRQVAGEASAENPLPRLQKDAILMKYGVVAAVIEREIRRPLWKNKVISQHSDRPVEVVWNSMMQEWFKATKGMTIPRRTQQRSSDRGYTNRTSITANPQRDAPASNRPRLSRQEWEAQKARQSRSYPQRQNNKRSSEQMDKSIKYPQN